jgi:hypothetical protein
VNDPSVLIYSGTSVASTIHRFSSADRRWRLRRGFAAAIEVGNTKCLAQ